MPAKRGTSKIDPAKYYSLLEIQRGGFITTHSSVWAVRKLIIADRISRNMLKAVITGNGKGTQYRIKGAHLAAFIKAWESGSYRLTW